MTIERGLAHYLEIMHWAGITELAKSSHLPLQYQTNANCFAEADLSDTKLSDNNSDLASISASLCKNETEFPAEQTPFPAGQTHNSDLAQSPESRQSDKEIQSNMSNTRASSKTQKLQLLANEVSLCCNCNELSATRTQTVFGAGNPNADLVFLGEAPGSEEDKKGEPFVGRAGQLLDDIITKGMKLRREDVFICNILRCRPPGNRNPLPVEAAACRPFLDRTIDIIKPKFICCLGAVAAQNLLGTDISIGQLRGKVLDYHSIRVVCTYHPAYLLRNPAAKKQTWEDIQILMQEMKIPISV
ncbi:MAG: uracil-DNA glycosylase [Thermoguttaceae bacterium]